MAVCKLPLCWNGKFRETKTESVTIDGNGLKIRGARFYDRVLISSTHADHKWFKCIRIKPSRLICSMDVHRLPILPALPTL